eukprot:GHVU01109788.1.p1 GENE.GHVU01109788.1~~GHVU01109788.1.p1  ORF type:complete len:397 (+),score=133.22 GHVU01109788.1:924-2114(+)
MINDERVRSALLFVLTGNDTGSTGGGDDDDTDATTSRERNAADERRRRGQAEEKQRKEEEARQRRDKMSDAEKRALELKEEGNKMYKARNFEKALELYDGAVEANPEEKGNYLLNKAAVYLEMEKYEECEALCLELIGGKHGRLDFELQAKVYARVAKCYARQGRLEEAVPMYEKSLMEDNQRSVRNLLKETQRLRDKTKAEAYVNPELAEQHKQLGNECIKKEDYPGAKREYDEAIRRDPHNPLLYSNRAAALAHLLEYPSALKDVEKALELNPKLVKVWSRKGTIHFFMKEYHKALEAYQRGLEVEPNHQDCRDGLTKVMGKIQEQQRCEMPDEEQIRHSVADPEIQEILRDPQFNIVLERCKDNPKELRDAMQDPKIARGIMKLSAAGILKLA